MMQWLAGHRDPGATTTGPWKNPGIWVLGSRLGLGSLAPPPAFTHAEKGSRLGPSYRVLLPKESCIVRQALFKIFSLRKIKHLAYISIMVRP